MALWCMLLLLCVLVWDEMRLEQSVELGCFVLQIFWIISGHRGFVGMIHPVQIIQPTGSSPLLIWMM